MSHADLIPATASVRGRPRRAWSDQDDAAIRNLTRFGIIELRRAFPGLTDHTIRGRVRVLGLHVPRITHRATWQRGHLSIPRHCHPLVKAVYEECNRQRVFLCEVAKEAGVTRQAMSRWGHAVNPHLVALEAVGNVLGLDLRFVRKKDDG